MIRIGDIQEMKKFKISILLFILAFTCIFLTACGDKKDEDKTKENEVSEITVLNGDDAGSDGPCRRVSRNRHVGIFYQ